MGENKRIIRGIINHSWVKPYIKENKVLLLLVLFLSVMTITSAGALMFTSGYLISKSATQPENILLVYIPIVLVRTFGIARPVFKYLERLTSHNLVLRILSKMRVVLYRKLERQVLTFQSRFSTGDLLGILADDLEHIQNLYLRTIFPSVTVVILYVMIVMALGFFSIPFALLMFLLLFVMVVIFPLVSLLFTRKQQIELKQARSQLYQTLADAVMGLSDWQISGRQADFLKAYEEREKKQDDIEYRLAQFDRRRNFLFQVIIILLTIVMMGFASFCVEQDIFVSTWIAAFVLVVFPLMEAFMPIPEAVSQVSGYDDSLSRLENIEETQKSERVIDEKMLSSLVESPSIDITLTNVSFAYDENRESKILDHLSLHIAHGEKIALLGKSGAGKSTLVQLLLGSLKPSEGQLTINGVETVHVSEEISRFIAVLQQKPHLFDTSVMNNIRLGNPQASDEDVIQVAKQVQMHEYISSLPDGYHTRMRELGSRFSGGERQRIALARILLQQTPIVILDEPTVGLDAVTERALLQNIFQNLKNKTVIWITHHLVGVEQMNQILFIEEGKFVMQGTHQELLHNNPRYARLYKLDRPNS